MNQLLYHMVLENFNTYEHRSPMGAVPTKLQESALERFLAARPYVLSQSAATKIIDTLAHEPFVWPPYFLPLPFNTVWIEALGGAETAMSLGENHENGEHLVTFGFLIEALDNGNYWVAILRGRPSGAKQGSESDFDFHIMYVLIDPQVVKEETKGLARIHLFFYEVFNNLRGEFVLGHEKVNLRARVGQGKARRLVKIKDIVHIVNRIEKRQLLAETSRQIDWSHRWEVMGHWRKFDGIGKDQKGSYCVRGMTWISPHVKGPEDRDLVTKTRFIDPKKGTEEK